MSGMSDHDNHDAIEQRIDALTGHLSTIRRNMEKLIAENQRLREVVRLAEAELRKRRDQVHRLESELNENQNKNQEILARVDNAIGKVDHLINNAEQPES